MMDLSDGLAKDLPRLAKASGCGFSVDEASLPLAEGCDVAAALGDGEDYELLFTIAPDRVDALMGRFAGRIRRDQWVEQARLLAAGDSAGFAAQFGNG